MKRSDIALAAVVVVSRAPFLAAGYGSDTDTWKVANAARQIGLTGRYVASRLPGFPVQEWVSALFWRGGPVALNALTAAFTTVAAVLFARYFRESGGRDSFLAGLAFACVPTIYISSTSAIDYLWAMAFLMGAFLAANRGWIFATALALSLATGARITSACFVLPLALVLGGARPGAGSGRRAITMAAAAAGMSAAIFLPVYLRYGSGFLSYYEPYGGNSYGAGKFFSGILIPGRAPFPLSLILGQATVEVWGLLGCVALALALVGGWIRRHADDHELPRPTRASRWAWGLACTFMVILYLRLPHDEGYLIPMVPFVLLFVASWTRRRVFQGLALAIVISPFVLGLDVEPPKKGLSPDVRSPLCWRIQLGHSERFVLDALRGPLIEDYDKRVRTMRVVQSTLAALASIPPRARVIVGAAGPELFDSLPGPIPPNRFFNTMSRREFEAFRAAGDPVYVLPDAAERTQRAEGYDPMKLGAIALLSN